MNVILRKLRRGAQPRRAGVSPLPDARGEPGLPRGRGRAELLPTRREEVAPVSRREAALLLTSMLVSVAICCALLNLVFYSDFWWSLFIGGAMAMLWVWFVPPLLTRKLPVWAPLTLDVLAVGAYLASSPRRWTAWTGSSVSRCPARRRGAGHTAALLDNPHAALFPAGLGGAGADGHRPLRRADGVLATNISRASGSRAGRWSCWPPAPGLSTRSS